MDETKYDTLHQSFLVATSLQGIYVFSRDDILHQMPGHMETSAGQLVKEHFLEVKAALYCAWLMREGRCLESVASYAHTEADLEGAPSLEKVLDVLEEKLRLITDGAYGTDARRATLGADGSDFRYAMELSYVEGIVIDLRSGRYHESGDERYVRLRGIPRIETCGRRLFDGLVDLFFRMDGGGPSLGEEILERTRDLDEDIFPDI